MKALYYAAVNPQCRILQFFFIFLKLKKKGFKEFLTKFLNKKFDFEAVGTFWDLGCHFCKHLNWGPQLFDHNGFISRIRILWPIALGFYSF